MSYQTITDILASSPNVYDFQKTVKLEPVDFSLNTEKSNTSFRDLVSSYSDSSEVPEEKSSEVSKTTLDNENSKVETEAADEKSKTDKVEEAEKKDFIESKNDSSTNSSDSKVEETDERLKVEVKEFDFEKKSEIQDKNSENQIKKNLKNEKSQKNSNDAEKKSKKIEADFSQLERLTNSSAISENRIQKNNVKENVSEENEITFELNLENSDSQLISEKLNDDKTELSGDFKKLVEEESEKNSGSKEKSGLFLDKEQKISVEDQRTQKISSLNESSKSDNKNSGNNSAEENNFMMQMNQENAVTENVLSMNNQSASANGSNFQAMLSNQISQNASEIVKSGNIILKDNNQGTINLVLHPDDLGNVKIHLSMDGKTLSGHIAVTTKEALQVFKDNAETLREAFIKNGFDVSNFDVSLNNGSFAEHNSQDFLQDESSNYFAKRVYESSVDGFSENSMNYSENFPENSNYSINIVA